MPTGWCETATTLGSVASGTIWADISWAVNNIPTPVTAASVSSMGASANVHFIQAITYFYPKPPMTGYMRDWLTGATITNQAIIDAVTAFCGGSYGNNVVVIWGCTASAPGDTETVWTLNGWLANEGHPTWSGPTEISAAFTVGGDAKLYSKLETTIPTGFSYMLDTRQRTGTAHYFADEDTQCFATCGAASASGDYGAGVEYDLTEGVACGVSIGMGMDNAPVANQNYITVTASCSTVPLDFSSSHFYILNGGDGSEDGDWTYAGPHEEGEGYPDTPDAADVYWYIYGSGNSLSLRRGAKATDQASVGWSETYAYHVVTIVPRLWKADKLSGASTGAWQWYGDGDTSAGHAFDISGYLHDGDTAADVSVAPSLTGYTFAETWCYGNPIPDSQFRKFVNAGDGHVVKLRHDWLVANDEDVAFTNPLTNGTATGDIPCHLTFHPLSSADPMGSPWCAGWLTYVGRLPNLDKPDGTNRPSDWVGGTGVTITGQTGWAIPAAGGIVSRTLATRRKNRMTRFSAHQWPTIAEVSHDWPIMTRANLDIAITGDDENWWDPNAAPHSGEEAGCEYEDVTDWRALACVQLTATGAAADIALTLRLTYKVLTCSDSRYMSAYWNFGAEGDASATWGSAQTVSVTGTLDSATGTCVFDLMPDAGSAPLDLELVEKVEFIFPAGAQTLTLTGWEAVSYAPPGVAFARMRNAHLLSDYFGAEVSTCGGPNYVPSYGYADFRNESGFARIQFQQPDPDVEEPGDDPKYLKLLARFYNETTYAETCAEFTWGTAQLEADLEDADHHVLAEPYWGDWDEFGGCLHVGTDKACHLARHIVYADIILQGGVRGIIKADGVREPSLATTTLGLYYSDDAGVTKTEIRTGGTNVYGEYRIGSGREKSPRTYYLRTAAEDLSLGSFVSQEYVWHAVTAEQWLAMTHNRNHLDRVIAPGLRNGYVVVRSNAPDLNKAWLHEGRVFPDAGDWRNVHILEMQTGWLYVHGELNGQTRWARNMTPRGVDADWQEVTAVGMAGVGLLGVCQTWRDQEGGVWMAGYDATSEAILLQRGKPTDMMAEALDSGGTQMSVQVVECVLGSGEAAPLCCTTRNQNGHWEVLVTRASSTKWYRAVSLVDGFTEIAEP